MEMRMTKISFQYSSGGGLANGVSDVEGVSDVAWTTSNLWSEKSVKPISEVIDPFVRN